MEQCEFCNNMFGNTKMLKQHQKKTKYCLKIQEIKAKEHSESKSFIQAKAKEIEELELKKTKELILKEKIIELTCQFCGKHFFPTS